MAATTMVDDDDDGDDPEYGKTLRARFAGVAGSKGIERRETRGNNRVLVGRKANLEVVSGDDSAAAAAAAATAAAARAVAPAAPVAPVATTTPAATAAAPVTTAPSATAVAAAAASYVAAASPAAGAAGAATATAHPVAPAALVAPGATSAPAATAAAPATTAPAPVASGDGAAAAAAPAPFPAAASPAGSRFRRAARQIIRQGLETRLEAAPGDKRLLERLGSLALADGDLDEAVYYLHCAAKGSSDDGAWLALARAEVKAWERDPAVGHDHLRMACDAHRRSIDLLQTGFAEAWEMSSRLLELAGVYESFGAFEGALSIYQRIASSMAPSAGFENVLFRCAVVMRYMASLENSPRERLLHSAMEHLSLVIQGQASRQSRPAESATLLYADVCMLLAEGSEEAKKWAGTSCHEVFGHRKDRGDSSAMAFRSWDDWIASPQTQLELAREWARKGEPTLAVFAYQKASKAFEREKEISPGSTGRPSFSDLMDMAETYSSFQRFDRAEEVVREAVALEPESVEGRDFLRCLLGNENCRRKEMRIQVALHLQSKFRTRVWSGKYLASLKKRLQQDLEERLRTNRMDVQTREQLSYFFQQKHRPVLLFEDRCAVVIQRLGRVGLFRLRWFAVKQKAYRKHLAAALKRWQKNCWAVEARELVRARARSQYTPRSHKIVTVVALMDRQDQAAPYIQRAARVLLARKLFAKMLEVRSEDMRRKRSAAVIVLQCQARSYLARRERRRRVSSIAERKKAAGFIQRVYRARALQWPYVVKRALQIEARRVAGARLASARKIQAAFRGKLGRDVAIRRRRAVLNVQRSARGFLGRKRAETTRLFVITRIQRQWRQHRRCVVIRGALLAIRLSREAKEARAQEVERRFRVLEEERRLRTALVGGLDGAAASAPVEERRAARRKYMLIRRVKAKGWRVKSRAGTCARQGRGELPPPAVSALRSPSTSAAPCSQPDHGLKEQLFAFKHEEICSGYECSRRGCENVVRRLSSGAAAARRPAGLRHHAEGVCRTSFDHDDLSDGTCRDGIHSCASTVREPSSGRAAEPVLVATASSSSSVLSSSSSSSFCALNAPAATLSAMTPTPRQGALHSKQQMNQVHTINNRARSSTCKRRLPSAWSPRRTSATTTAAMACARGVGGRLGTPLGSPHPALEKRIGSSHPVPPASTPQAAKKAKIAGTADGGGSSAAPGSRFFPPFMSVSAANCGGGSPVVYEMVKDAADDEEDAFRRGPSSGTTSSTSGEQDGVRELGWNGFTLYRPPGVCARSLTFQLALQLQTIAFSPDVQQPPPPPPPRHHDSTQERYPKNAAAKLLETPHTANTSIVDHSKCDTNRRAATCDDGGTIHGQAGFGFKVSREKARTFESKAFVLRPHLEDFSFACTANEKGCWGSFERSQGGRREERAPDGSGKEHIGCVEASVNPGHSRSRGGNTSSFFPAPHGGVVDYAGPKPLMPLVSTNKAFGVHAKTFDDGDMVMVANLLAHPESSLKRIILHRANIDTKTGRDALLKCVEINKLGSIALGGCTWFGEAVHSKNDGVKRDESAKKQWWTTFFSTIRVNAFRLEELVLEGLEREEDALGVAISDVLDDYFVRSLGRLAAISLVRCGMSDEGAKSIARGIAASSTLTYLDLSGFVADARSRAELRSTESAAPME